MCSGKMTDSFSLPQCDNLEYSLSQNDGVLRVTCEGVSREYVLLKGGRQTHGKKSSLLLEPEFTFQDTYGAFQKERLSDFVTPERNNLDQLRAILRTLAQIQSETNVIESEYQPEDIAPLLDYFKSIENAKKTVTELQTAFNRLLESNWLVKSIWPSHLGNNVYVSKDNSSSLFLAISSGQPALPAYDALLYIFSLSDEQFRQKHFDGLASFYFKSLHDALQTQNKEITRNYAELQLAILLPIIKLKLVQNGPSSPELLSNLSNYFRYPLIQQEDVYQVIKNKLSSVDYNLLSYKLVPLDEKNGFLGEYFHLTISINVNNKQQTLDTFAKFIKIGSDLTKDLIESGVVKKEDFFYGTIYPLCQNHGLEEILDFAPKCYLSRLRGFLVLDDLGSLGYKSLKPNTILNRQGIEVVLKQLSKLHASSLILEEILSKQLGRTYRLGVEYAEYLEDVILQKDSDSMKAWYNSSVESGCWVLSKYPDLTESLCLSQEDLRSKLRDLVYSVISRVKTSNTIRNVVNHGDMYTSNVLVKFEQGDIVEDAILVDFQVLRYVPPAYEVLFFIFASSSKESRDKYLQIWLDYYYSNLSNCIRHFDLDPDEIYTRKHFEDDLRHVKPASLGNAFNYAQLIHNDPDLREEIIEDQEKYKYYIEDHKDEFMTIGWKEEHFRVVLRGLLEDFVDLLKGGF